MLRNDLVDPDAHRFLMEDTMNHTRFLRPVFKKKLIPFLFWIPFGAALCLLRFIFVFLSETVFFPLAQLTHTQSMFYKGL